MPVVFTSFLTSLGSGDFFSSVFFTSGVVPGLTGETDGEGAGEVDIGLADETGTGVVAGLFGAGVVAELHAPTTAEAAKTVAKINDLLIVFLLISKINTNSCRSLADILQPD